MSQDVWDQIELKSRDLRNSLVQSSSGIHPDIIVVDIDDPSIKALSNDLGRWPWSRSVYKDLLAFFSIAPPKIILFDILFSEPDRHSDGDAQFAATLSQMPNVSQAVLFLSDSGRELGPGETFVPFPEVALRHLIKNEEPVPQFSLLRDFLTPAPTILSATHLLHSVNALADLDGTYRRLRLSIPYSNGVLPTLSSQALRTYMGDEAYNAATKGLKSDEIGLLFPEKLDSYTTVPIAPILQAAAKLQSGEVEDPAQLAVNPLEFENKIVLIGTSAVGLEDLKNTPLHPRTPGVYLHATGISNVLNQDYLRESALNDHDLAIALILALAIYSLVLFTERPIVRIVFPLLVVFGYSAIVLLAYKNYLVVLPWALPLGGMTLGFLDAVGYMVLVEGKAKKQMQGTLGKYLPPTVIEQMIASGQDLKAEIGKKEELSILFSDIRGFTTLSEKVNPDQVVAILNQYLGRMTDCVFEHQGTLDKFIGDAVMAFWGAPVADPQHALKSVRCAMAMRSVLAQVLEELKKQNMFAPLEIGVGINTGHVIVGNIGSERKLDYTVIGDNVNLASRLEGLTKQYHVDLIIGERTFELVKSEIACRTVDRVRVKGKTQAVAIFEPMKETQHALASAWEKAWRLYQNGNFADAIKAFELCQTLEDRKESLSTLYIERCREIASNPDLARTFDGTFTATSK